MEPDGELQSEATSHGDLGDADHLRDPTVPAHDPAEPHGHLEGTSETPRPGASAVALSQVGSLPEDEAGDTEDEVGTPGGEEVGDQQDDEGSDPETDLEPPPLDRRSDPGVAQALGAS